MFKQPHEPRLWASSYRAIRLAKWRWFSRLRSLTDYSLRWLLVCRTAFAYRPPGAVGRRRTQVRALDVSQIGYACVTGRTMGFIATPSFLIGPAHPVSFITSRTLRMTI